MIFHTAYSIVSFKSPVNSNKLQHCIQVYLLEIDGDKIKGSTQVLLSNLIPSNSDRIICVKN